MKSLKTLVKWMELGKNIMTSYRKLIYGYCDSSLTKEDIKKMSINLKERLEYINHSKSNSNITELTKETLSDFILFTGQDLKPFLIANYNNGLGLRSHIVKVIVDYLNETITNEQFIRAINNDVRRVLDLIREDLIPLPKEGISCCDRCLLTKIENTNYINSHFKIVSGLGADNLIHLLLTFNMEGY